MTNNDHNLLQEARRIKYWEYMKVNNLLNKADTSECRYQLKNIRDMLYDVYINGGRTD